MYFFSPWLNFLSKWKCFNLSKIFFKGKLSKEQKMRIIIFPPSFPFLRIRVCYNTCNFTYNFKGVRNSGLKTHSLQDGFNGMLFPVRDVYVICG